MHFEKRERIKTLRDRAKQMRRKQTPGERAFWEMVRARRFRGHKFRRQHVIDPYIVDFYCHDLKLIIEIDGPGRELHPLSIQLDTGSRLAGKGQSSPQ